MADSSDANKLGLLQLHCADNPDDPVCADVPSFYEYRVSLTSNAIFLAIFGLSFIHIASTLFVARSRALLAFNTALLLGLLCEVLGYAGRIISSRNPWDENGFMVQICCLTIGPAFLAAACYLCLRRVVRAFGEENSRLKPEQYTRVFIPCDVVSLILQAVGGALAATASHEHESPDMGSHIMVAGLAFQVFTMMVFLVAAVDFALRARRRGGVHKVTRRFKMFVGAVALASVLILWRSAFRVAELSQGWSGPIIARQELFIGFEGVLVVVAVLGLNVFHPAFFARDVFDDDVRGVKTEPDREEAMVGSDKGETAGST